MAQPEHDFVWAPQLNSNLGILTPVSAQGEEWAMKHLPQDALSHGGGVVVETRYIDEILSGIAAAELTWVTE